MNPFEPLAPSGTSNEAMIDVLLQAARFGDVQAVGRLLEICRSYLLLVANREVDEAVRQRIGASDLVQESLTEAWQGFKRFSGDSEAELLAWLKRILLNNIADARESCNTQKRDVAREVSLDDSRRTEDIAGQLAHCDPSPSGCAAASEQETKVFAALQRLPAHYAQAIRLRNFEYLPFPEIATRMGMSFEGVRKLWERAVRQLAKELRSDNAPT